MNNKNKMDKEIHEIGAKLVHENWDKVFRGEKAYMFSYLYSRLLVEYMLKHKLPWSVSALVRETDDRRSNINAHIGRHNIGKPRKEWKILSYKFINGKIERVYS